MNTKSKKGSVMIGVIVLAIIVGVVAGLFVQSTMQEYKLTRRTSDLQSAMNLAESGLDECFRAYNAESWTGWTGVGSGEYWKEITGISFADGTSGRIRCYIEGIATSPILVAEGTVFQADGTELSRQIRVDTADSSILASGLIARNQITMNGNNTTADSYNSSAGAYDASLNANAEVTIGSLLIVDGAVGVGNADIRGYVATGGGQPSVGNNGFVMGMDSDYTAAELTALNALSPKIDSSRVTTDFYASFDNPSLPDDFSSTALTVSIPNNDSQTVSAGDYDVSSVSFSGQRKLIISGDVRMNVAGEFGVSGQGEVVILDGGSLELYVAGDVSISGNGGVNEDGFDVESGIPEDFQIFGMNTTEGDQSISVAGNGSLYATVYAPNANVSLNGGGSSGATYGSIVAYDITLTGHYDFHYDEALEDASSEPMLTVASWRELRSASSKYTMSSAARVAAEVY